MAPKIAAGVTVVAGNMNLVTLVSTVVARNSAVQPGIRCAPSMPYSTTRPETMPIKLMATCSLVKAAIDSPRIMKPPCV